MNRKTGALAWVTLPLAGLLLTAAGGPAAAQPTEASHETDETQRIPKTPSAPGPAARPEGAAPVDAPAPRFKLRTLDGALVRLDEIAYPGAEKRWAKKHPVLVDFFRTDCRPCRAAMPELVAIHKEYRARGLEVLLVALLEEENGRAKLERYLQEQDLPFRVVIDPTEHFAKQYLGKSGQLPATFLIDHTGVIRASRHKGGRVQDYFAAHIRKVLEEKSK